MDQWPLAARRKSTSRCRKNGERPVDEAKFRDTLDGLSNTIAMGEIMTALQDGDKRANGIATNGGNASPFGLAALRRNPSLCQDNGYVDPDRPQFWLPEWQQRNRRNFARGHRWADALPIMSAVVTILPPNRESCGRHNALGTTLVATVFSRHQGGAHVLMADGAVIFMTVTGFAGSAGPSLVATRRLRRCWFWGTIAWGSFPLQLSDTARRAA
ncbi:hypothetical protein Mal15_23230 [Stieleria maiorica]|uniref:DUF1559 domain-containing protein n=1 Tax=Stieleria maiorica TaxID=2795974 RepID=A0A5B9MBY1_9BACT|nr:hypothetical protein Mal15_23230 [Stieleria maiorica]